MRNVSEHKHIQSTIEQRTLYIQQACRVSALRPSTLRTLNMKYAMSTRTTNPVHRLKQPRLTTEYSVHVSQTQSPGQSSYSKKMPYVLRTDHAVHV